MPRVAWNRLFGTLTLLGCTHCAGTDDEPEPLEVRVLAAGRRIEVYTRKPGDCHSFGEFRGEVACESSSWRVVSVESCIASSCVREMRVEQDGEVLARSGPGRFAAFDLEENYGADARLVIDGCGESIELALPRPKDDVEFAFTANPGRIELSVTGRSTGTFATASSYAFSEGHAVVCQTDAATSLIPVSDSYSFYRTAAFAFDDPLVFADDRVRAEVFPSAHAITAVSTQDFGPLWDAAVTLAEASSHFQACTDACAAVTTACGETDDDVMPCVVPCVAAGEVSPNCEDEYRARVECASANSTCESTPTPNPACAEPDANWSACAEQ